MTPAPVPHTLLLVAGPAGTGKSTLCDLITGRHPDIARVVTTTERPPRPSEVDGKSYHFLTPAQFDEKLAANDFLEWALVHQKHRYGTSRSAVLGQLAHSHLALVVDVQGVKALRESNLSCRMASIFLTAPVDVLRQRIAHRGGSDPADLDRRMASAEREMQQSANFDFVIPSGDREDDYAAFLEIWRQVQDPAFQGRRGWVDPLPSLACDQRKAQSARREITSPSVRI